MTETYVYIGGVHADVPVLKHAGSSADASLILYTIIGSMIFWNVLYSLDIVIDIYIFHLMSRSRTYMDCVYQRCVCICPGATGHKVIGRHDELKWDHCFMLCTVFVVVMTFAMLCLVLYFLVIFVVAEIGYRYLFK